MACVLILEAGIASHIKYRDPARVEEAKSIAYDLLINATGGKLKFWLGPHGLHRHHDHVTRGARLRDLSPRGALNLTHGEIGLAGQWMKFLLHHAFIYQSRLQPG